MCNGELDDSNGLGECRVGGHQVIDGGILLDGHICKIVEGRGHLLRLLKFGGLVGAKRCFPGCHAIDATHFGEGSSPIFLPGGPCVVGKRAAFPFAPGQCHVATR